ncbi:hypothetical protein [Acidithiobacillus concretivorus]|uniref:Uncharacterized protein n=1 Tax=Acidithiobacillus concretivorus TaxID=3063952 RepID=A0ABS5ZKM4_9PROT|nr:hypothetical protein [Acidithiobacillus concretivorus]MBU2737239.1 hypothetical protein [Acidithiobacillus concretivorus]
MSITTIIHCLLSPNLISIIGLSAFGSIVFNIALLLILLLQMVIPGALSQKYLYKTFFVFSVPVVFFGLIQIIDGYNQITITIFNEYVKNVPYDFYGFNRPYSLFTQSSNFGWFMAFLSGILWLLIKKSKDHIEILLLIFFMIISMSANVLSFTRVSIMAMLFIFVFLWLNNDVARLKEKSLFLPFYFLGATLLILFFAGEVSAILKLFLGVLSSSKSTTIRVDELIYYLKIYDGSSWWKILIGIGPIVDSIPGKTKMFIDNTYLYILLHQGLIGLLLWFSTTLIIWRDMYRTSKRESGIFRKAIVAYWSTWLAVGVFATDLSGYILMAILFYMLKPAPLAMDDR